VSYVLDSWAVMAWLMGVEPARRYVRGLLEKAATGRIELWMNMINVGEIFYLLLKRNQRDQAEQLIKDIGTSLPIKTVLPDREFILEAARLKGQYAISYADAFAAITAIRFDSPLVTGDPEFQVVSGLRMNWIGAPPKAV